MTVSIPLVVIFGISCSSPTATWGSAHGTPIVALIFGFLLAATTAAPEIRNLLSSLVNWLNKP